MCSFLNLASALEDKSAIFLSLNNNSPEFGESNVPNIWSNVVFPAPEAPTIEIISPLGISKSTPFNTSRLP